MRKMKLDLSALTVESFDADVAADKPAGTVRANEAECCANCGCCPCECTCCAPCYPQTSSCPDVYTCAHDTCQYNTCDPLICWYQQSEGQTCMTGWCPC